MNMILSIAAGGAIGSVLRHYAVLAGGKMHEFFPYGTLLVNVTGSFLIGAIMQAAMQKGNVSEEMRAFLVMGFLGGFTTFSAFSYDFFKMADAGHVPSAILYACASVALSLLAVFAGVFLVKGVFA